MGLVCPCLKEAERREGHHHHGLGDGSHPSSFLVAAEERREGHHHGLGDKSHPSSFLVEAEERRGGQLPLGVLLLGGQLPL
jgi:hypothetical protein